MRLFRLIYRRFIKSIAYRLNLEIKNSIQAELKESQDRLILEIRRGFADIEPVLPLDMQSEFLRFTRNSNLTSQL